MRERLAAAVTALLQSEGLISAPDGARLAAVVLLAKSNAAELTASATAGELGRWLGISGSQVSHTIRPRLQQGVVASEDKFLPSGRTASISWRVELLAWARHHGKAGHPLRLTKPELATLLRLCEALFGPGWTETPPGLLATRTGHGAATDRLALLLAVLHGRADGTVRLCGGAVDSRGRLVATVARLLGCGTAAAQRTVARLQACEAVAVLPGARERLVVPAVAAAYRQMRAAARVAGRAPSMPRTAPAAGEASAGADQIPSQHAKQQVERGFAAPEASQASAALHADHSPVARGVERGSGSGGFSGEAPSGTRDRPVRAQAREDHAQIGDGRHRGQQRDGVDSGALRAEQHKPQPLSHSVIQRVPRTGQLLAHVVGKVTRHQRHLLDQLVDGLLLEGEDDAMIAARLRARLAPLATGDPDWPWEFRRDGLSWALKVGLPYTRGGMTLVPCQTRGCGQLVRGRATAQVRCDDCEIAAMDAALAAQPVPSLEELERMILPCSRSASVGQNQVPAQAIFAVESNDVAQPAGGRQAEVDEVVLPQVVREQIDIVAAANPTAGRAAERAAVAMYEPASEEESEDDQRYRKSKATTDFYAVTSRFADVLAAHYDRSHA